METTVNYSVQIGNAGTYHVTDEPIASQITIASFDATIWSAPLTTKKRKVVYDATRDEAPCIPFEFFVDQDDMHELLGEHAKIMTPAPELGEGMFAISSHLGECRQPKIFTVNGERRMEGATGLTQLEKIIYYEAQTTAQGDAVLPHEDHSKRAWYKYAGGIKNKFKCTTEQAEEMAEAFRILDTTSKMATTFERWIAKKGFAAGLKYFRNLASQLVLVTDEGEPVLDMISYDADVDPDCVETERTISAEAWHKLDDPRDEIDEKLGRPIMWEDRQPKRFQVILAQIRTANLPQLKTIGKLLFNDKSFTKTQTTVLWDEYKRRKHNVSPHLSKLAITAMGRLADPQCDLKAVAAWLHGDGKKRLTPYDQEVIWSAWYARKNGKTSQPNIPFVDIQ